MAEIDRMKPIAPIWPAKPERKVEEDDEPGSEQQRNSKRDKDRDDNDRPGHIDEYV